MQKQMAKAMPTSDRAFARVSGVDISDRMALFTILVRRKEGGVSEKTYMAS